MRRRQEGVWFVALLLSAFAAAAPARASAVAEGGLEFSLFGDVKTFAFSVFPYESALLPDDPFGQAVLDLRLKLDARYGRWLRTNLHHQLTTTTISGIGAAAGGLLSPAQGESDLPEAVDLSWRVRGDRGHLIEGRMDRLELMLRWPRFHLIGGRQAVTFGRAYFFTPLDLVAPFSPLVVDREYKPGIDALRADYFFGVAGQVTAVAAYAGGWDTEGLIFAGRAGTTVRGFDLALFAGAVRGDAVLGIESSGAAGPVAIRAEGAVTIPDGPDGPFVRVVAGADHLVLAGRLQLTGEVYLQTIGATEPEELLAFAATERVQRGELWTLGRYYAAASASYELSPLVHVSGFTIANLGDPSLLLGPGLTWSIADAARMVAGAYFGIGERPLEEGPFQLVPQSELGLYPTTAYVSLQAYF